MKLSSFFRMAEKYVWPIIKMIIVPLVAMFFTKAWNPSQLFSFIPEEYFYEAGLTLYVASLEGIAELAEHLIKKSDITIQCIWYTDERLENSHSKPQISMNANNCGYSKIFCHVIIDGNYKRLKDAKIDLEIPSWFTVQFTTSDYISLINGKLIFEVGKLLPQNDPGEIMHAEGRVCFDFLSNVGEARLIDMKPTINKEWRTEFSSNGFNVQNVG